MTSASRQIPMFPLGSVLLPQAVLPLHIFEDRYQQLLNHALEGDRTFGVVLISRGSEVGGGDERTTIGTLAEIQEHRRFDDGRAAVVAVGISRFEVVDWLPDDPYPRALIADLAEIEARPPDSAALAEARGAFDALLATAVAMNRLEAVPDIEWAASTSSGIWQLASIAPIGELDRYALLAEPEPAARIVRLRRLIEDLHTDLRLISDLDGG